MSMARCINRASHEGRRATQYIIEIILFFKSTHSENPSIHHHYFSRAHTQKTHPSIINLKAKYSSEKLTRVIVVHRYFIYRLSEHTHHFSFHRVLARTNSAR
jgi:hypothetical protein